MSNTPKDYFYADAAKASSNKFVKKLAKKRIQNGISKKEKQNFAQMKKRNQSLLIHGVQQSIHFWVNIFQQNLC